MCFHIDIIWQLGLVVKTKVRYEQLMIQVLYLLALLVFATSAMAVDISILDCNGITRASKRVQGLEKQEIKLEVQDATGQAADGTEVSLTNSESGEVVTATSQKGIATFPELSPGTWVASSSASGVTFTAVSIAAALPITVATGAVIGAAVVGGGAIYGGAQGIIALTDDDKNSDGDPLLPSPDASPAPTATPPSEEPCNCDPDEDADELDDFFGAKAEMQFEKLSPFS